MPRGQYDVFLSYNTNEKPSVEALALRLRDEAMLKPWLDVWYFQLGAPWADIVLALDVCTSWAIILGEHGWGEWHLKEAQEMLARRERNPSYCVIPILLPMAREEDQDILPGFFVKPQCIDFSDGLESMDAMALLVARIRKAGAFTEP